MRIIIFFIFFLNLPIFLLKYKKKGEEKPEQKHKLHEPYYTF
jgi:hypothetical protein